MTVPPRQKVRISFVDIAIWIGGGGIVSALVILALSDLDIQAKSFFMIWLSTIACVNGFSVREFDVKHARRVYKSSFVYSIYLSTLSILIFNAIFLFKLSDIISLWIFECIIFAVSMFYFFKHRSGD